MKKEKMTVIDVNEFPDPVSDAFLFMPEEEEERMDVFTEYIQLATSVPHGTSIETDTYCRKEMEDGELCDGSVDVKQIDVPKQVRWTCRKCGDAGALINYEGTVWDNSHLSMKEKERFLERFFADIEGDDIWEDDWFYGADEGGLPGPLDDFEYYLNPFDPDGEYTGAPSSSQIKEMLEWNWLKPDAPVYLKASLTLNEAERGLFFYNARRLLQILHDEGMMTLTRSGLLKRQVVRRCLKEMRWPDGVLEYLEAFSNGKPDETDIPLLHGVRVLVTLAGLVEEYKEEGPGDGLWFLRFNDDHEHLLADENAGELYRQLFSTYFKDMNLGFLGSSFEFPHLQYSIPFILYQLHDAARDWVDIRDLMPDILLNSVKFELQFGSGLGFEMDLEEDWNIGLDNFDGDSDSHSDRESGGMGGPGTYGDLSLGIEDFLFDDLFAPLERFGLLETKSVSATRDASPDHVRMTDLFYKFVQV